MGNGCCGTIPSIGLKVYSLRVNPRSKAWDLKTKLLIRLLKIVIFQKETRKKNHLLPHTFVEQITSSEV